MRLSHRIHSLRAALLALLLPVGVSLLGCNPDVRDGVGPIIPVPNVVGVVYRDGTPASDLPVAIRDEQGITLFGTRTDTAGGYGLADIPPGAYEIKVSGKLESDFDSVRRPLIVVDAHEPTRIADLDIDGHGATIVAPEPGAELARPSPHQQIVFTWEMPTLDVSTARVNLFSEGGEAYWSSARGPDTETSWNGIGSEGLWRDRLATGDLFTWRVKLQLADGSEARLAPRELRFTGPQHEATTAMGTVHRDGASAAALAVALRDTVGVVFLETVTDELGDYSFGYLEPGPWEVKVSGSSPADFRSVSYEFEVVGIDEPFELPELDVYAFGAETLLPEPGGTLQKPGFFTPLEFSWTLPAVDVTWARVKLYDAAEETVWSSVKQITDQATWNGIANEGDQTGQPVAAGDYTWRIKLEIGEAAVARLALREIHFVD